MKKYYRLFIFGFVFVATSITYAQTLPAPVDLNGFAWSSNIGWISLNCKNDSNCDKSDYKVTINADRTITGWGWSSNIGWIRFGGLSGFPVGGGTVAENANVTGTYPNLTMNGWARACAGDGLDGSCNPEPTTSVTGISWTKHGAVTNASRALSRVAYGNGLYVSLGLNGLNVLTSSDGVTWTPSTNLTGSWTNITFGNGMFVAAGRP